MHDRPRIWRVLFGFCLCLLFISALEVAFVTHALAGKLGGGGDVPGFLDQMRQLFANAWYLWIGVALAYAIVTAGVVSVFREVSFRFFLVAAPIVALAAAAMLEFLAPNQSLLAALSRACILTLVFAPFMAAVNATFCVMAGLPWRTPLSDD